MTRLARARLVVALALMLPVSLALGAGSAAAEGPNAVQTLAGCTTDTLPPNDDGSTGAVTLPFTVDFNGSEYSSLFVNNNGNVTFETPLSQFTPFDFTISGTPMIAPFLADVDTRGDGSGVVTYGNTTLDGKAAFCVNWIDVGYFSSAVDKKNSFQLLLVQQGTEGDFDIVFNYDKVQWETGNASGGTGGLGGTPAAVGWANGDGEHSYVNPGSFTSLGLLDSNLSTGLTSGLLGSGNTQLGRYVFPIRNSGATGPALSGYVEGSGGGDVVNGPVEICPQAGGPCRVRNTNQAGIYRATGLAAGAYNVTAHPPSGSNDRAASTHATVAAVDVVAPDLALLPGPQAPPDGTSIESIRTNEDGIPVVIVGTSPRLATAGCPGGAASFQITLDGQVLSSGTLAESPSGQYSGAAGALNAIGDANVRITIDCPTTPNEEIEFGLYIDPSGNVRNSAGQPVAEATVILLRSSDPAGPFLPVPNGSAVMSPSNRTNPDETNADGHFGWDVVAGYYRVRASKDGCVSNDNRSQPFAETQVLTIPPPVTDLDIRLYCGEGGGGGGTGGAGGGGGTGGGGGGGAGGAGTGSGGPAPALASLGKLKLSKGKLAVPVFCASTSKPSCSGSVTITTKAPKRKPRRGGRPKSRSSAKSIKIGSAKFSGVKPGTTKQVKVALNRVGLALLRKGRVQAKVSVTVKAGSAKPQAISRSLTLSATKKKSKKG